jgi:hypothetical protein
VPVYALFEYFGTLDVPAADVAYRESSGHAWLVPAAEAGRFYRDVVLAARRGVTPMQNPKLFGIDLYDAGDAGHGFYAPDDWVINVWFDHHAARLGGSNRDERQHGLGRDAALDAYWTAWAAAIELRSLG